MFLRLLTHSLARRRSRKMLAVLAVWIGVSLVVGLLALSLDVGDKLNREMRAFGANIKLLPATDAIPVRVGGYDLTAAAKPAYLADAQLDKLDDIFWSNNLLGVVPRLWVRGKAANRDVPLLGVRMEKHGKAWAKNSAREFYDHWQVFGRWPATSNECLVGTDAAKKLGVGPGAALRVAAAGNAASLRVAGVVSTGGGEDGAVILSLPALQNLGGLSGKISEADISALTTPENRLAEKFRLDPKSLTPTEYDRWFCTPFPGSIAADVQRAVPGSVARVVRRVSETQGVVLSRIQGLMALLALLAATACVLSVMGVLISAVLERRTEVALFQAIGAQGENVLRLFLAEAALLGLAGGTLAAGTGAALGIWLVRVIFGSSSDPHYALVIFAPLLGLLTALAASALPTWHTLRENTAEVLHGN